MVSTMSNRQPRYNLHERLPATSSVIWFSLLCKVLVNPSFGSYFVSSMPMVAIALGWYMYPISYAPNSSKVLELPKGVNSLSVKLRHIAALDCMRRLPRTWPDMQLDCTSRGRLRLGACVTARSIKLPYRA